MSKKALSRRDFLKGAAAAAGLMATGSVFGGVHASAEEIPSAYAYV